MFVQWRNGVGARWVTHPSADADRHRCRYCPRIQNAPILRAQYFCSRCARVEGMIRFTRLDSFGRITKEDTLQSQVGVANVAKVSQPSAVQKARFDDLAQPLTWLCDEGITFPGPTAVLVTQKLGELSLREEQLTEWLGISWPRPKAAIGLVAAVSCGCPTTHILSCVLSSTPRHRNILVERFDQSVAMSWDVAAQRCGTSEVEPSNAQ
eukprot:6357587-Lingulodinium_polyedra.AAC.1